MCLENIKYTVLFFIKFKQRVTFTGLGKTFSFLYTPEQNLPLYFHSQFPGKEKEEQIYVFVCSQRISFFAHRIHAMNRSFFSTLFYRHIEAREQKMQLQFWKTQ